MTDKTNKTKLVLIYETPLQSWISDAGSFLTAVSLIGVGVWLDSSAMQWTGAALFFLTLTARGSGHKRDLIKTPQQAADWLAATFNVRAK